MLTAVYIYPHPNVGRFLWEQLDKLDIGRPWMLICDFNYVLKDEERSSKVGASTSFQNWVRRNSLIDLGYIGNQYTWRHGVSVETWKAARLNRALRCDDWRRLFPSAIVRHLSHAHFDHCWLLLEMDGVNATHLGERPFRFQVAWLMHADFFKLMEREWAWSGDLMCSLKCFSEKLIA